MQHCKKIPVPMLSLCLVVMSLLLSCTYDLSGSGTEGGNTDIIAGTIIHENGAAADFTQVTLIPSFYNPSADAALPDSFIDTTDHAGAFNFAISDTGMYAIQAVHLFERTRLLVTNIHAAADTVIIPDARLKQPGKAHVFLPDTIDTINGYLFIQGTLIFGNLSDATPATEGYSLLLDSVPEANVPGIHYGRRNDPAAPRIIADTLQIVPGDTAVIEAFMFWAHYTTANSGLTENRIDQVVIASDGALWFHQPGAGVVMFNGTVWTRYHTGNTELPSDTVTKIAQAKNGDFWFATARGVARYNGSSWTTYTSANSDLPYDWVTDVALDSKGNVWLGMTAYIARFNGSQWTVFDTSNFSPLIKTLQYLTVDNNDKIWIATDNGVINYDSTSLTVYTTSNCGIYSNQALIITVDNHNNKWFSHNNGVSKFDGSIWTVYTAASSPVITGQTYHTYHDTSGNTWVCTATGLTRFDGIGWRDYAGEKYPLLTNLRIHDMAIDSEGNKWVGTFDKGVIVFGPTKK